MKYSRFNSIVSFDNRNHLYNSFTQKFIIIDDLLKELLEASKNEDINDLENIHPDFYSYLILEKFLVDDNTDEINKVKEIVKNVDENINNFFLTINPTMNCNFKCWYCYETHIKKSSLSVDMINRISKFIQKTCSNKNIHTFNLAFFGGEPLLYFKRDVIPIIDVLQDLCIENRVDYSVSFTTNGYLINSDFLSYFKNKKIVPHLQITLDGYKENHDKVRYVNSNKGSYDVIIQNIITLLLNSFHVRLRVNYTSENIEDTYKISEEFKSIPDDIKKKYLLIDFHRVWQDSKDDNTPEIVQRNIDIIRKDGIPVKHMSPNNVLDSCYADKRNSAVINYNGDLFKCTARDFTTYKRSGYIDDNGTLVWENDSLEKRMNIKFKNPPCLNCRLLPICNGGCSQHAVEAQEDNKEYCIYSGDDKLKDDAIISKIKEIIEYL